MVAPAQPHEAQEQTFARHLKYTVSMARGDEDLRQELALAAWTAIRDGVPDDKLVAHVWRQRSRYYEGYLACDKYGCSLDRGHRDHRRLDARAPLYTGDGDEPPLEPMVLEAVCDVRSPARLALFNIAYERFLASLSPTERHYWELRADGYADRACYRVWSQRRCIEMRLRLRRRFAEIMES